MSEEKKSKREQIPDNLILVGAKSTNVYALAAAKILSAGAESLTLKARGRNIPKAIEAYESLKLIPVVKVELEKVEIGTEPFQPEKGLPRNVPAIWIHVKRVAADSK